MYIELPNKYRVYINQNDTYENKLKIIQEQILDKWSWYFEQNWLHEENGRNITREILNKCAYCLCFGETKKRDNILSRYKQQRDKKNEVLFSNLSLEDKAQLGLTEYFDDVDDID